MDYFPIFVKTKDRDLLVCGGGDDATHKVRLLLKTSGQIHVFGALTAPQMVAWRDAGKITHNDRPLTVADCHNAAFAYIATDSADERDAALSLCKNFGLPFCVVDDQARSGFITPALVDRDPVVIAIGTEGNGPVIARDIKARIEKQMGSETGLVAKTAGRFRESAETLPKGAVRRGFWMRYLDKTVPSVLSKRPQNLEAALTAGLGKLLKMTQSELRRQGGLELGQCPKPLVIDTGATILSYQSRRAIHNADVVLHTGGVGEEVLELTRRESKRIDVTRLPKWKATEMAQSHAKQGLLVVYLFVGAKKPKWNIGQSRKLAEVS